MKIESEHEKQNWTSLGYVKEPVYTSTKASTAIAKEANKAMLNALYGTTADVVWTDSGVTVYGGGEAKLALRLGNGLLPDRLRMLPNIEKVIFNPPATIVMWSDGTKTVVKAEGRDDFSEEYGLAMAIARKYFGSRSAFLREVANAKRCGDKEE